MKRFELSTMSIHEKICQTVILNTLLAGELSDYGNPSEEIAKCGGMEGFLREYPVGALFVGGEAISTDMREAGDLRDTVNRCFNACPIPMLFVSDLENGCGCIVNGLTEFPHLMALGACDDDKLAYDYGRATALEALSVGIRWTFSPVADLNMNRWNPVTNNRCMGDNAEKTTRLIAALVKGMQDGGLAAAAKHFPGDGTDDRDQHLVTTNNRLKFEQWVENHGKVFQTLVDCDVMSVMTGHISLSDYQNERLNGRALPATLSWELTTGLLKDRMGFHGVVVSDALMMGGYLGWYDRARAQLETFKAGTDMMLWPVFDYIQRMKDAIAGGEVSMDRLDDAVSRILAMKERLGLFEINNPFVSLSTDDNAFIKKTARDVAEKSITLVKNTTEATPLSKDRDKRILMVGIMQDDGAYGKLHVLEEELRGRGAVVDRRRPISFQELERIHHSYDRIIYVLYSRPHVPKGPLDFSGQEAASVWAALSCAADKSIVLSLGSPYFIKEYFEAAPVSVNAYSDCEATIRAMAKGLYGEIPFKGNSPVDLDMQYH